MRDLKTISNLEEYYAYVQQTGKLRSRAHAQRWSRGILNMLGVNLGRSEKKELVKALPEDLQEQLNEVFWLAFFRNTNLTSHEFQNRAARRSGNTDPDFAKYPVRAVFGGLKGLIDSNLSQKISHTLSPELSEMWNEA